MKNIRAKLRSDILVRNQDTVREQVADEPWSQIWNSVSNQTWNAVGFVIHNDVWAVVNGQH